MHKTMVSIASLEKIETIRNQEFMLSKVRLKFLKKMIILGPKTAILAPQFCKILVLGPHFWWSGGPEPPGPPGSTPAFPRLKDRDGILQAIIKMHHRYLFVSQITCP